MLGWEPQPSTTNAPSTTAPPTPPAPGPPLQRSHRPFRDRKVAPHADLRRLLGQRSSIDRRILLRQPAERHVRSAPRAREQRAQEPALLLLLQLDVDGPPELPQAGRGQENKGKADDRADNERDSYP